MTKPVFRLAYGPKLRVMLVCEGKGRTKQSFKGECDINNIMAKFQRTGALDWKSRYEPQYADVTGIEFQAAQDLVAGARSMFEELPSSVRSRFENDPAKFLAYANDPANGEGMIEMGLATRKAVQATPLPALPAKPVVEAPQGPAGAPSGAPVAAKP
jgi:phage internal scaffolding protein